MVNKRFGVILEGFHQFVLTTDTLEQARELAAGKFKEMNSAIVEINHGPIVKDMPAMGQLVPIESGGFLSILEERKAAMI
ncbi:hypothetical protein [Acidaminococcus fermentans]|uniref:hypothetical protein n=1 Tax=Acidaminococcus fermentans TaxID=905 RepID=UPI000D1036F9|nr:hypothetical protein [Acidaminococcus fermentans]